MAYGGKSDSRGKSPFGLFGDSLIGPIKLDHRKPVDVPDSLRPTPFYYPRATTIRRRLVLKIARRLLVLALALMTSLALVAPAFAQGAGQAQVRVAHLAPDAPNVDVYVNGEPVLTDVPYTTVSDYLSLPAGTPQATVYATGDPASPALDAPA